MKQRILSILSVLVIFSSAMACPDHEDQNAATEQSPSDSDPTDETILD